MHASIIFLKAFLMGMAAATPFLSFATGAFLLGSYQTFLNAVRSIFASIGHLCRLKPVLALQGLEWKFLLLTALGGGAAFTLFTYFMPLRQWYLQFLPEIYALISGMILGGLGYAFYEQRGGNFLSFSCFVLGIAGGVTLLLLTPDYLKASWLNLFLMGGLAVLANFTPAIPDEIMGRLLGGYQFLDYYWQHQHWLPLLVTGIGSLLAILFLAFTVSHLLTKKRDAVISLWMGLLATLLIQIWPFKFMQHKGEVAMMTVGIMFLLGCTMSSLMHKYQQRTVG
jgi:uncharacterized membrane protein